MTTMPSRQPLAIELAVGEAAGVNTQDYVLIRDDVASYLSQLLHDLSAPVDLTVTIRAASDDEVFLSGEAVRLFANKLPLRARLAWRDADAAPVEPAALARRINHDLFNERKTLISAALGSRPDAAELASLAVRLTRLPVEEVDAEAQAQIDDAHDAAARLELRCSPANRYLVANVIDDEVPDSTSLKLLIDVRFDDAVADATIAATLNDVRAPMIVGSDEDDGSGLDAGLERGLRRFIRAALPALVSRGWAGFLLGRLSGSAPTLVIKARQRFDSGTLARVLRALVTERIRTDDIRAILDSLLAIHGAVALADYESFVLRPTTGAVVLIPPGENPAEFDAPIYAEAARKGLARAFLTRTFVDLESVPVFTVEPGLLILVDNVVRSGDAASRRLALSLFSQALVTADEQRAAILVSSSSRRALAELLRVELPDTPVVTFAELPPEARVSVRSRITVSG